MLRRKYGFSRVLVRAAFAPLWFPQRTASLFLPGETPSLLKIGGAALLLGGILVVALGAQALGEKPSTNDRNE